MKLNKLLEKQLNKFFPASSREEEQFREFLKAVNDSYNAYERDAELSDRAFRISEEEYRAVNEQLKQEIELKETSIEQLNELIKDTGAATPREAEDKHNLLHIAAYLRSRIADQREAERKLQEQKEFYEQILNQIPADISVVDQDHHYLFVNPSAVKDPHIRSWIIGKTDEEYHIYRNRPLSQTKKRMEHFYKVARSGKKEQWEERIVTPTGNTEYHLRILHPVFDETDTFRLMIIYGFNITARIEAEQALKISEEKYRSIITNMNLGMAEVDTSEMIIYANQSFCEMSGYQLPELIGKHAPTIFLEGERLDDGSPIFEKRQKGISDAYEQRVRNKNGEVKWWLVSGAPVFDAGGAFAGSIGIHLDITVQKILELELRKAKSDAERSAHSKELFLANISHEIRTPMNAILGISRLLAKTEMNGQQRFYIDTIRNAGNSLQVIINDLLDFSKIEAGRISFEYIGFNLEELIRNAIRVLKYKAEEKGLALDYSADAAIATVLIGDPYRINQVLMNLLSNAIKFTEQGSVTVGCTLMATEHQIQRVVFRIADTGIGISEAFIDHLFDKFAQEDESVTRKFGGTGLGMSITKQLIELMGGSISVESRKHEGTMISFILSFPIGTAADLPEMDTEHADTGILKGRRILLAEDNAMNRLLVSNIMAQYGAVVVEAEDGSIAIEKFREGSFDLILMDIQMPVKDGLETTKYIRSYLDQDIPIIALTANAFKQEEERCLQAGMNDFIAKPFDEDKMVRLLAQWLGRTIDLTAAQHMPVAQEQARLCNLEKLKSIGRGDVDFLKKMLQLSVDTMPDTVQQMEEAYNAADWKTLAALAHRIKPSVLTLGIAVITDDILSLETVKDTPVDPALIMTWLSRVSTAINQVVLELQEELQGMD